MIIQENDLKLIENRNKCSKCETLTDVSKSEIREDVLKGLDELIETNRPALEELAK